jgi:hypothetical protein
MNMNPGMVVPLGSKKFGDLSGNYGAVTYW